MFSIKTNVSIFYVLLLASSCGLALGQGLNQTQDVKLTFYTDQGSGLQVNPTPIFGLPVFDPESEAQWAFQPQMELKFSVETNLAAGQLHFELRESAPAAQQSGVVPPGEPSPSYTPPVVFWSHTLNLATVSGIQTVTLPLLNEQTLGGDPDRVFYFGIYADGSLIQSKVDAFFNHQQIGTSFSGQTQHHPAFHLPVLYHHPEWAPTISKVDPSTDPDFELLKLTADTQFNLPLYRGTHDRLYRLVDTDPDPPAPNQIIAREWSFYEINNPDTSPSLTLLGHFPGTGYPTLPGSFCDVLPPKPQCGTAVSCPCSATKRYLVTCNRIDKRGASSLKELNLNTLSGDAFIYEIGPDLATLNPPQLDIWRQHGTLDAQAHQGTTFTLADLNGYPLKVRPFDSTYDCWAWFDNSQYQIRYQLASEPHVDSGFLDFIRNPSPSDVNQFFATISGSDNSPGLKAEDFPIRVQWQIKTPFRETDFSEPIMLTFDQGIVRPNLSAQSWPATGTLLTQGSTIDLAMNASPVQGEPNYGGTYSVWLYDVNDRYNKQVRLERSANAFCKTLNPATSTTQTQWTIPDLSTWNIEPADRFALRVKFIWHPIFPVPPCTAGPIGNALDHLESLITGVDDAIAGYVNSPEYGSLPETTSSIQLPSEGGALVVYDPSGSVNFQPLVDVTTSSIPVRLRWLWQDQASGEVWHDGMWKPSTTAASEVWPLADGQDAFANRWTWDWLAGRLKPQYVENGSAPPFENWIQSFFGNLGQRHILLKVIVDFQNGETAEAQRTLTIQPDTDDTLVTSLIMKTGGNELTHLHTRAGNLPDLEWTIQTSATQTHLLKIAVYKENPGAGWERKFCGVLDDNQNFFTTVNTASTGQGQLYTLMAKGGSGLYDLFQNNQEGRYQIRFSGEDCTGGNWDGALATHVTLNPAESFRIRMHFRDHLGSSTVSRAYTPDFQNAGASAFSLPLSGNDALTLYPEKAKRMNYTPFGNPTGESNSEPNPRYTDHEYDAESGLNYMKGRYQLPDHGKFNRPDPLRDWDWENPSSINLYQYVRNNPVMSRDPNGFFTLKTNAPNRILEIAGNDSPKVSIDQDGIVKVNASNDDLQKNEGLRVLHQAATSENVYIYEEGKVIETKAGPRPLRGSVENLDVNEDWRYNVGEGAEGKKSDNLPPTGVHAIIVYDQESTFVDAETKTQEVLPYRTAFHEIAEALAKIEDQKQYVNKDGSPGAHAQAVEDEKRLIKQRPNEESYPAGGALSKKNEKEK